MSRRRSPPKETRIKRTAHNDTRKITGADVAEAKERNRQPFRSRLAVVYGLDDKPGGMV